MKKFLIVMLLTVLACSTQAVTTSNGVEKGYISVSATENSEMVPDTAELSIAVQTFDTKSMQKATIQNKEISEKIINILKSMINTSNGDYIKTSDYNASPVYNYTGGKRVLEKYQVSNSVIVHTKSLDKIGEMIDKSILAGATNVNRLSFSVSNYENQCNNLLERASKKALSQANIVAKTIPTIILGVRSMDISCSANNAYTPQYRMLKSNMAIDSVGAVEASSTTIEKGVVKIFANVNASYFVK